MKYTSAKANKLLKSIEQQIKDIKMKEHRSAHFRVAAGEDAESIRPAYDFAATQTKIDELESAVRKVKHAINTFNVTHTLPGFDEVTIDQALVYIPQLSQRVSKLQEMAASLPKERIESIRNNFVDYSVANYDIEEAERAYEEASQKLATLQLALDAANTTGTMEIDVELN